MKRARCVVYEPPSSSHPVLAVAFASDGQLLAMRTVPSRGSIETTLTEIMAEIRANGGDVIEWSEPSPLPSGGIWLS
jgi:hypothetical protein